MNILVINCGSSSLKFQLIDIRKETVLVKGNVERIGEQCSIMKYQPKDGEKITIEKKIEDHVQAYKMVIAALLDEKTGIIKNVNEISAVGHRVVHGGERFSNSVIIDDNVMKAIEECIELAPLHNPPNLDGIKASKEIMPNTPMVAVFDTAFHQTMPKRSYIYAIPYDIYDKYKIRKYGFHGTSHQYVFNRAIEITGKDSKNIKAVTCHLGNGASACAILNGESVDTSMGFTPLAGLAMGTRSGSLDPDIITYIMRKEKMTIDQMDDFLNKKSGVLGISGISNDFRDVKEAALNGNERAQLAIEIFAYRVKKYISMYAGIMGGIDILVFTAGIGEKDSYMRELIVKGLDFMGIEIDTEKNKIVGEEIDISQDGSKVKVLVVPTNEELMIARETARIVK